MNEDDRDRETICEILECQLAGMTQYKIIHMLEDKYAMTFNRARYLVDKAYKYLVSLRTANLEELRAEHLERLNNLYCKALLDNNLHIARTALYDIAKVEALNKQQEQQEQQEIKIKIDWTQ